MAITIPIKPISTNKLLKCQQCGKKFKGYLKNSQRFCSKNCKKEFLKNQLKERRKEIKQEFSDKNRLGASWKLAMEIPSFIQSFTFGISYDTNLSKNRMAGFKRGTKFYFKNPRTREIQELISWEIKNAKLNWVKDKMYVSILVQKPYFGTDAINFVDTICDAIQGGTGINDCWIVLDRVDWQVIKKDPMIFITISQSSLENKKPCSSCGRILPEDMFAGKKTKSGECRECKNRQYKMIKK